MSEENAQITTVQELEYYLDRWLKAYEEGKPLVSDECYDHYKKILEKLQPDSAFLQKIGNKPKKNKEKLPYILGSLKNKTIEDIDQWLDKYPDANGYILSHKMDGVAIECEYIDGKFSRAWLRGDHYVGENITHKAKHFVPPQISSKRQLYLKGEMLLNCEPSILGYKNKRNAVAGIINRDDFSLLKHIYVIFHTIANLEQKINETWTERARIMFLEQVISCVRYEYVQNRKDIISVAERLIKDVTQYDKDGIVIAINNSQSENVKIPEMKVALKFNMLSAETEVDHVEWNTSRTGKVIPLIYIKPVDLGGATITKCAGFNTKYVLENFIDKGAKIKIVRSGDVIPYIDQIIQGSEEVNISSVCSSCDHVLVWDENSVNLLCVNSQCPAQIQKRITHFFEQLGLEQFGEKMIFSLNCNSITEILNLTKEDILKIPGWAEKSTSDFLNRIQELKKTSPEKILAALGIENLGTSMARLLLENFSFDEIINSIYPTIREDFIAKLIQIKGVGSKKAISIIQGLYKNIDLIKQLQDSGLIIQIEKNGKLKGLSFCITGTLSKPRKEIEKLIEDNGGVNASINTCNYLICNEKSDSSKYKKAVARGIEIITEKQLMNML
jgi:DNA ligase (NAD+)